MRQDTGGEGAGESPWLGPDLTCTARTAVPLFAGAPTMDRPSERRYFPATVMAGRLYLDGQSPVCWTESQVDVVINPRVGHRKIEAAEELEQVIRAVRQFPSVRLWIAEGLEDAAQRHCEGRTR